MASKAASLKKFKIDGIVYHPRAHRLIPYTVDVFHVVNLGNIPSVKVLEFQITYQGFLFFNRITFQDALGRLAITIPSFISALPL